MRRLYRPAVLSPHSRGFRPLDLFQSGLWECYGLQRLLSTYSGPLIRIRRSSDNAETDIRYGTDDRIDQAAITTFAAGGDAFVTKFYGQTVNVRDMVQTGTTAKQPRIVSAGTIDLSSGSPFARFDATDDCMQTPALPGSNSAMSYVMYGAIRAFPGSGFAVWLESTADAGANAGLGMYFDFSSNLMINVTGPPTSQSFTRINQVDKPNDDVSVTTGDRPTSTVRYYRNGVFVTPNSSSGGSNTGNYAAAVLNVGARNNGATLPSQLNLKALAVYTTQLSAIDIAAMSPGLLLT